MSKDEERIDNFRELLGAFGGNSNLPRRERREQRAGVDRADGRRKPPEQRREAQLAVRIRRSHFDLLEKLRGARDANGEKMPRAEMSQADLIEELIEAAAKKRGIE
jgi:hypothetical protein